MSIIRRMKRAEARRHGRDWPAQPQPSIVTSKGYRTLRPTKGWLFISKRRIAAQRYMAMLLGGR